MSGRAGQRNVHIVCGGLLTGGPAKVSVDGNGVRLTLPRVLKEGAPKTQEVAKRRGTI